MLKSMRKCVCVQKSLSYGEDSHERASVNNML